MSLQSKRFLILLCIIAIVGRPMLALAQEGGGEVANYVQSGERAVVLKPGIDYNGHLYEIHYFTTGDYNVEDGRFISSASPTFFQRREITVVFVTEDGRLVRDEALMREILTLYRAAYTLYERQPPSNLGYLDATFVDDFRRITDNLVFVSQQFMAIFSTREEETEEAFRGIVTAQMVTPDNLEEFGHKIGEFAERGNTVSDAIDWTLEAARFSNDKSVRDKAKDIRKIFESWKPVTDQGRSFVEFGGQRLDFYNALDILSLSIRLVWLLDLQVERSEWINTYTKFATGDGVFDQDQLRATATIEAEVGESSIQRANIVLDFVKDKTINLTARLTTKKLSEEWVRRSWARYGTRIKGHLVAGVASSVILGFTLGDLIFGLDDLYNNFKTGERTDELRHRFRSTRLQLEERAETRFNGAYNGQLASEYRIAYMLESLAAAQMYRLYADGVHATINRKLFALVNPVLWFEKKDWSEAVEELHDIADDIEEQAEDELGHPAFIDVAVEMALQRLKLGGSVAKVFLVDDSVPGFDVFGSPDYWWSAEGGYAGAATWTFCDARNSGNSAHWKPAGLSAGFYRVEANIPRFSEQYQKPFTHAAHYTIMHAGQTEEQVVNLENAAGTWAYLGEYYFDGNGEEYVQLVDTTGEANGSTTVVFDAIRWQWQEKTGLIWDAKPSEGIIYDIIVSTEVAQLEPAMQNTGQAVWSGPDFSLKATNTPSTPPSYPLQGSIAPGQIATWDYSAPTAGSPGIHRINFQMYRGDEVFGQQLTAYVIILPEPLKDIEQQIRDQIDEWQRQGEQAIEELMQQIWEEIQKELEKQAQNFLDKLFAQCFGPSAILGLTLAVVYHHSRRHQ